MVPIDVDEILLNDAVWSQDPVERHLMKKIINLTKQNARLKEHIESTSTLSKSRPIDTWTPFNFFHYFCTKYRERYNREFKKNGNVARVYFKIDSFRTSNSISKEDYKKFIDSAFFGYFNNVNTPTVSHICSAKLYNYLMAPDTDVTSADDLRALDKVLATENSDFEQYMDEIPYDG